MSNPISEKDGCPDVGGARRSRRAVRLAALALLLFAGCSGGKEEAVPSANAGESALSGATAPAPASPRKEFVAVRELLRQHELQQGNAKRIEAVETALKERFPLLPDEGKTEEEKRISQAAKIILNASKEGTEQ